MSIKKLRRFRIFRLHKYQLETLDLEIAVRGLKYLAVVLENLLLLHQHCRALLLFYGCCEFSQIVRD